ncbi:MAG: V-type ATP synthase subunit E [Prolixibacteraceae bacterium]|nr:V-type ATP synthase subunit E [Prolixibacteraceae bacterium]
MEQKLKEITEKLYQEGVEKGNQEAEKIIAEAKDTAKKVIEDAKKEAASIISTAEKEAGEMKKNTRSELQLASKQLVASLEQELVSLVNGKIVEESVKKAVDDKQFMQELIVTAVENWTAGQDVKVFVNPSDKKEVEGFFASKAKEMLDKGLVIESANNVKAGFQIGPSDGSYKVSFSREDFINFFKEFLRPKVVELLFGDK